MILFLLAYLWRMRSRPSNHFFDDVNVFMITSWWISRLTTDDYDIFFTIEI
jgi:hypothetical protein